MFTGKCVYIFTIRAEGCRGGSSGRLEENGYAVGGGETLKTPLAHRRTRAGLVTLRIFPLENHPPPHDPSHAAFASGSFDLVAACKANRPPRN